MGKIFNVTTGEPVTQISQTEIEKKISSDQGKKFQKSSSITSLKPTVDHQKVVKNLLPWFKNGDYRNPQNIKIFEKLYESLLALRDQSKLDKKNTETLQELRKWLDAIYEENQKKLPKKTGSSDTFIDLGDLNS